MAKKKASIKKKKVKRQLNQGVDTMEEARQVELIFETQRNVAILSRDVESIKQDIKEFKTDSKENMDRINKKLDKLMEEPVNDMKFFKNKIFSLIISGIAILAVFGMGVWVTKITTETKQITQQYEQQVQ